MCLSFLYLCLCLSFAPEFARRTTPSRLWDGYLPHKQPHLEDSGLLQLPSLSSKPALCLCVSVRRSVSVCLSSSVGFSVSLSLFWIFLRNFATALKIIFCLCGYLSVFLYWFLCFYEFLCFGFITQFFTTCSGNLVEALTSLMDFRDYPTSLRARLLTRGRELRDKRRKNRAKQN